MFRRIKNQLVRDRKVIRASGRDTGDNTKLSRDKITDLSHQIVTAARKERYFRVKKQPNDLRLEIVKIITEISASRTRSTKQRARRSAPSNAISPKVQKSTISCTAAIMPKELKRFGIDLGAR
jgi:uncharacterized protein